MPTDPLSSARYPSSGSAPNVATDIQNAVNDLSSNVPVRFASTSARDSAYQSWVNAGHSMVDGLVCIVAGQPQLYRSGAWGRMGDVGKPRISINGTITGIPSASLWGLGPANTENFTVAYGGDTYISAIQDGVNLQPGVYSVAFRGNITNSVTTSGRSFLDILVNNVSTSRVPMTSTGEDTGSNSTTLFISAAAPVKFAFFITTAGAAAYNISYRVDMFRVGDW